MIIIAILFYKNNLLKISISIGLKFCQITNKNKNIRRLEKNIICFQKNMEFAI